MFDRLLLPTDGSDGVDAVFEQVLDIAAHHGAILHVLHVADTTHDSVSRIGDDVVDAFEREGETLVADTAARAADRGIDAETAVVAGDVPETITEYAASEGIDCIVMPTHGRTGLSERFLGSTTERVSRLTTVPVLTLRPDNEPVAYPFESLLVPTDGSEPATVALKFAVDLAGDAGGEIHLLSAVDVSVFGGVGHSLLHIDSLKAEATNIVDRAADLASTAGVDAIQTAVEAGSVPAAIRSYAVEQEIGCIVIGTHGRTGFKRYLLGSVTEAVLRSAAVPVLVVPTKTDNAGETAGAGSAD